MRVSSVEATYVQNGAKAGEEYLKVEGTDMNGEQTGVLRLWKFEDGDIESGSTIILRGMKVAYDRVWSTEKEQWEQNSQGPKIPSSNERTAVEDVSDVTEITAIYDEW